jgi:uncharacterized protein YxeA
MLINMEKGKRKQENEKGAKSNKKKIIILFAIIVIAIIIAIVASKTQKTDKEETTQTEEQVQEEAVAENNTLIDYTNTDNVTIDGERKENTSSALLKEKTIDGLTISEISLYALNGQSNFTATVTNNGTTTYGGGSIEIVFLNEDGSEYGRLQGYLPEIEPGASNKIDAATTSDLTNAYDFDIEF